MEGAGRAMQGKGDNMYKIFGHFVNKWDVLMWSGVVLSIASDLVDWVGSNVTILLGIAAALIGGYKSYVHGQLLREQRKTERLEQEKLKQEIRSIKKSLDSDS